MTTIRECGEGLYDPISYAAVCTVEWGTEHSHHDHTAREAVEAGIAREQTIPERLERLRAAIEAENISYGEIAELQSLAQEIEPGDVQLLEWAGVPESQAYVAKGERNLDADDANDLDPILTCDLCGQKEWAGDLTPDWNGDTGNHLSCEQEKIDMAGVGRSDHEFHGGAAGSFASEGCAECAAIEQAYNDPIDGFEAWKQQHDEAEPFDLATIDTDRNMRYVVHPFVSSEPYVNYCGLCALSSMDHTPGPDYVDPMDDEDGDPTPDEPDPDAMYDAAVDDATSESIERYGDTSHWREFMPGGAR
jgi:hypothetical protein